MVGYHDFDDYFPSAEPLWFVSSEVLGELYRAELRLISPLLEDNDDLPKLFDSPEATVAQRQACFAVLAHRKIVSMIDDLLTSRYEQSPALDEIESRVFQRTLSLVPADAPSWVLEMDGIIELLPQRMLQALPETLQTEGWYTYNGEKDEAKHSASVALSTVEQIQTFTQQVMDQQWKRFAARWPSGAPNSVTEKQTAERKKPKHWLKGTDGLGQKKSDLSRYMHGLTDKQQLAASLKWEYGLGLAEIASRMGIDRKTAYEHIEAGKKRMEEMLSNEKRNPESREERADW